MSLISCNSNCIYQKDGYCELNEVPPSSCMPAKNCECIHFVERKVISGDEHK